MTAYRKCRKWNTGIGSRNDYFRICQPTDPILFFWHVTVNTHIFFLALQNWLIDWLLFKANFSNFQLYHGDKKLKHVSIWHGSTSSLSKERHNSEPQKVYYWNLNLVRVLWSKILCQKNLKTFVQKKPQVRA